MNRNALALFAILIAVNLSGCQPSTDTNRNLASTASSTPAKETFDPVAIEAELIKLEREWVDAAKTHNPEAVRRNVADDAIIVYGDGMTGTKAGEISLIESKAITADAMELIDPKVTVLSADAAFITARSSLKNGKYKDPNRKSAVDISGDYRILDIYARRNGKWQAVASYSTQITNPAALASPSSSPSPNASPSASVASPSPSATRTP
jgi:hypothetical protein